MKEGGRDCMARLREASVQGEFAEHFSEFYESRKLTCANSYFNSVGSKDGWTPSTFVSSRKDRAQQSQDGKQKQQMRPEDFMDDEDLAERAEAQQLETQGAFAGLGSKSADGSAKGMFSDMFKTTGETMGVKLLQRMGWRQGQGVGARVKRRAQGDKTGEAHLFAPENTRMITFSKKTDKKGLGFAGEVSLDGLVGRKAEDEDDDSDADARILSANRSKLLAKPKKLKKSSFGVGVLNDTGSDDEDPYAIGPSINYSKIIGGDRKKRRGGLVASSATQRPTFTSSKKISQRPASTLEGFRRCHDGRLPLDGFVLSTKPLLILTEIRYPPPTVPSGWKPKRATKFDLKPTTFESTADAAKASSLDPKARSALLGEAPLPGKSIFDFITPASRDKLASASGRSNLPQARGESAPAGFEASNNTTNSRTLWDLIPHLDPQTASAALHRGHSGWMPYAEDLDKRARYTAFITLSAGLSSTLPPRPQTWTADQWAKELREFAQAAEVFKPISGLMATRFTTSTAKPKLATDAPDAPVEAPSKPADPAEDAAKAGMYGPLTRSKHLFYPTRLLCKRFGVKPPANSGVDPGESAAGGGGAGDGKSGTSGLVSKAALDRMMMHANHNMPSFASAGKEGGDGGIDETARPEERAQVDVETNEALEGTRPDEGVFKSVFEE
jgi:G patch domain-containing protein 1